MENHPAPVGLSEFPAAPDRNPTTYYSVEIPAPELGVVYQFKVWRTEVKSVFILVKENSGILSCLKEGDRLKIKYYSTDGQCPLQDLDTEIRDIARQEMGRLKGHCIVALEILKRESYDNGHWHHLHEGAELRSLNAFLKNI